MSFPRMRPYPQQGSIAIANGDELHIPIGGSFLRVREADQKFKILLDQDVELVAETNDVFRLKEGDKFKSITVINDSGAVLTFQLEIGDGSVETNNIAIAGTVNTSDSDAHTKLDILNENTNALENYISDLRAVLSGDAIYTGRLSKGLVDLTGASYAQVVNATTTVVSAAVNTDGVIIRHCFVQGSTASSSSNINVAGNNILMNTAASTTNGFSMEVQNIFIPAGSELEIDSNSASVTVGLWYEVL